MATKKKNEMPEDTAEINESAPDIAEMTAIRPEGIHERLEAAELAALGTTQEHAQALNRITLLTGALKTALPDGITHIADEDLKAGLRSLLDIL